MTNNLRKISVKPENQVILQLFPSNILLFKYSIKGYRLFPVVTVYLEILEKL